MISFNSTNIFQSTTVKVLENHISVKSAAVITGYNIQYLRRILRAGKLDAFKIGQVWLIDLVSLENYLTNRTSSEDRRCGPH